MHNRLEEGEDEVLPPCEAQTPIGLVHWLPAVGDLHAKWLLGGESRSQRVEIVRLTGRKGDLGAFSSCPPTNTKRAFLHLSQLPWRPCGEHM